MGILEVLKEKILICDGGMGSSIQKFNLSKDKDFKGYENCSEILSLTRADVIESVHSSFLEAGADIIETNTFGANKVVLGEFGLADKVREFNLLSAKIAKKSADKFSSQDKPRFVGGSIGPGTKLPSLMQISFDELLEGYVPAAIGLLEGGVDMFFVETVQDTLQAKAAVIACYDAMKLVGRKVPVFIQVTIQASGTMLLGTDISSVRATFGALGVDGIGLNCATGPLEMREHVRYLSNRWNGFISVQPNAGIPRIENNKTIYPLIPEDFADITSRLVLDFNVDIVGGCCGTTPEHIKLLSERLKSKNKKTRDIRNETTEFSSLYTAVKPVVECGCFIIGERINASGSKICKELLKSQDFDGISSLAKKQISEGAGMLDVNVAIVGEDEVDLVRKTVARLVKDSNVPLMIDSSSVNVIESALKLIGARAVVNSVNLEDGGKKLAQICSICKRFGAGVVALTIDENGMARTADRKIEIAERLIEIINGVYGIEKSAIFLDPLTFTLATGNKDDRNLGLETLDAISRLNKKFPDCNIILGVSNISYGLDPKTRLILNTVFLNSALERGMKSAILHAGKIISLASLNSQKLEAANNLIFNKTPDALEKFILICSDDAEGYQKINTSMKLKSVSGRLTAQIIAGDKVGLEDLMQEALKKYTAVYIVNKILLKGMKDVGEMFANGKMQLPFVLGSAEVMRAALDILAPYMSKNEQTHRGSIVLATVEGDVHDIGKNLVDIILSNNGYKVFNIGVKQSVENIIKAIREYNPNAVGMSGLLVKSVMIMAENLCVFKQNDIDIPVLVGGAALEPEYVKNELKECYDGDVVYCKDAFSGLKAMEQINLSKQNETEKKTKTSPKTSNVAKRSVISKQVSNVDKNVEIPKAPFYGVKVVNEIDSKLIMPFINKKALFNFQWRYDFEKLQQNEREKVGIIFDDILKEFMTGGIAKPKVVYGYFECFSEGNNIIICENRGRGTNQFVFPRQPIEPYLCVSDFFNSKKSKEKDVICLAVATIGDLVSEKEKYLKEKNLYKDYLHLHGFGVCFAEALMEYWHLEVRKELGIESGPVMGLDDLLRQKYVGGRFSFGYSACPDLENQKVLFSLLKPEKIGVTLTENFMMVPEQSISSIICHHPQSKHFSVI